MYFVLSPEICILTVTVTLYNSDIPFVRALCIKYVTCGYQKNDQM